MNFSRTLTAISTSTVLLTQSFKYSLNTFLQKVRMLQTPFDCPLKNSLINAYTFSLENAQNPQKHFGIKFSVIIIDAISFVAELTSVQFFESNSQH